MTPAIATLFNSLILIVVSLYAYLSSGTPSLTALIPAIFGCVFLFIYGPMKRGNKAVAHIIVILTLLLIISLIKPLSGAIGRDDTAALLRVGLMLLSSLIAMGVYVQSFIKARRTGSD
jgi:hypothetical protein